MRIPRASLATIALAMVASASIGAQYAPRGSSPWAAFLGCWVPPAGNGIPPVTCVVPVEGSPYEVDQLSLIAGNVVGTQRLRADGRRRDIDAEGCRGWESASFSDDAARVYTTGAATCAEGREQLTSGVLSITPAGEFLQVAALRVGEQRTLTTQTMSLLRWADVPPAMQERIAPWAMMSSGARTMASKPVSLDLVEEALKVADAYVVEAWMAETGTGDSQLRVTRRDLQRLAAANVPTRVIDMAVVLANPQEFAPRVEAVNNRGGGFAGSALGRSAFGFDPRFSAFCDQAGFGLTAWDSPRWSFAQYPLMGLYPGLGLAFYSWLPQCAGRGLYSNWAFGPFGFGNWYGMPFPGTGPVVVTTGTVRSRQPGTVTKGNGYSRGRSSGSSGGTGQPRWSGSPSSTVQADTRVSPSSSGSSSSGGTRSAGDNGSGRTAKPRNP